jgi:hypothetical protein
MQAKKSWKDEHYDFLERECKRYHDDYKKRKRDENISEKFVVNPLTGEIERKKSDDEILVREIKRDLTREKEFLSEEEYQKAFMEEWNFRKKENKNRYISIDTGHRVSDYERIKF